MMYCNFSIDYVANLVKTIDAVEDVRVAENDSSIIIAVKTKPLFSKTEINKLFSNINNIVKTSTDKDIYVTRNLEIFCDIENATQDDTNIDFEKTISKLSR